MEIFEKVFKRKRNKLYQSGGKPVNKLAGTEGNGLPEYALHFSNARKYFGSGELGQSLRAVNRAIELSSVEDWKQYALKGVVLENLQRYQEAIHAYEKAIEINSEDIKVYALYSHIGNCYMYLGNDKKALEFYSCAIELKKQHPNSPHDKDREGIENGVILGKEFMRLYFNRGNACFNLGQYDKAEKDCYRALEFNPDYANPYLFLYYIYFLPGQEKKAMGFLQKAVDLGNIDAQKILNDHCIAHYTKADNLTAKESAGLEECLNLTLIQRNLSEGKKRSLNLINKGINNVLPYFCLATIYESEENWKGCEEIAKAGLKFDDGEKLLLNILGIAVCKQGAHRIPEGLAYLEKGALAGDENCAENYKIWKSAAHN